MKAIYHVKGRVNTPFEDKPIEFQILIDNKISVEDVYVNHRW